MAKHRTGAAARAPAFDPPPPLLATALARRMAWEFLRRNPRFRAEALAALRQGDQGDVGVFARWGLRGSVHPDAEEADWL